MRYVIIAVCLLVLSGCGAKLTTEQFNNADFGPRPDNYEEIVKAYYAEKLLDPYSAQYEFDYLRRGYLRMGGHFGWVVCGTVNAKNRIGGYTGAKNFYVMIRDGRVIKRHKESSFASGLCKGTHDPEARAAHEKEREDKQLVSSLDDPEVKLVKLEGMLKKGIITQDEYDTKRKAIIDSM